MSVLSPFQTLPLHIAEAIGRYCNGLQRHLAEDTYREEDRPEKIWLVLHDVSHSWMQLARRNLNKNVRLWLPKGPENYEFIIALYPRRLIEQRAAIIPHVKTVRIYFFDIAEEPGEENLKELDRTWPEDLVFPKARSLICKLGFACTEASDDARNGKYFRWFMERVRSSFPSLQALKISLDRQDNMSISSGVLFAKNWNASLFLSALFMVGRWVSRKHADPACINIDNILMNNAPELSSFRHSDYLNGKFSSWVIQKSAKVLEKLHYHGGFRDFMLDDDGKVIVYPRLGDLHVFDRNDDKSKLATDKSIVPFPALQRLKVYSRCVFKDDTLFRGLNGTLISLDIGLHREFVDIFREHNVLLQGTYPAILHITATHEDRGGSLMLPADEFVEAAFGLVSPATQSIKLVCDIPYSHIASAIPKCSHLEGIQILLLEETVLSLLEILDIIKHFPQMTDFGCSFGGIDSELDTIHDRLIPSHLGTQHSQINSRLKCWHVYYSGSASAEEMAVLVVTLVVLCPNFTFVREQELCRDTDANRVRYILSSGLYDQHAKRLRHLVES